MISKVKMNWTTEHHSFELKTHSSQIATLDFLADFIGSLEELKQHVLRMTDRDFPEGFKVEGGSYFTEIEKVQSK